MAGPKYSVDTHPQRDEIIKAIIKGEKSYRAIGTQYGLPKSCITRYLSGKLAAAAAKVRAGKDEVEGKALSQRIETVMERMQKLYDACDEYLQDPEDPKKYNLHPRAWELDVAYRYTPSGSKKSIMKTETLQDLLDKAEGTGISVVSVRSRTADPRKLIIDTADAISKELTILAKIEGAIKDQVVNVTVNQVWIDLKTIIMKATDGAPEVRTKIIKELEKSL